MPNVSITAFLIRKSSYADLNAFLATLGNGVSLGAGVSGTFYAVPDDPEPPTWVRALGNGYLHQAALSNLLAQSPAGLIICKANRKVFVITFGHAWMKLSNDWIDQSFGRRVVLNTVDSGDLRQLRSEQVLAKRHRSIERSPVNASLYEFGYESDRDLVFSVEGVSRRGPFFGNIRGGAPIRFDIDFGLLPRALTAASSRLGFGYQKKFPDIDNLLPVKSRADIDALDTILDTEISGGNLLARVGLAPPASLEVIDQDVYFSYGRWNKANHARSWSLQYQEWVATLGGRQPSLHEAREDKIHVADAATGLRRTSIKVKDALSFDTVRTDGHYLIFSGNWYRASPNLNNKLNAFLGQLQASAFPPPQWDGVSDEGSYNVAACNSTPSLIHMDARNVFYGPGQSKFEFCDFLDPTNKILYFVKNPSSSAGMSHLYEQARRTAELFFGSNPDYIDKLRVALLRGRPTLDVSWLSTYSRSLDWEICLVSMGRAASSLPMFAKCGLMRVHRELASRFRAVTYCVA